MLAEIKTVYATKRIPLTPAQKIIAAGGVKLLVELARQKNEDESYMLNEFDASKMSLEHAN
jgi:hypothetical protein